MVDPVALDAALDAGRSAYDDPYHNLPPQNMGHAEKLDAAIVEAVVAYLEAAKPKAARAEIMRLIREDFDPTPPNWEDREWNDNAEDVADKIIALFGSEKPTAIEAAKPKAGCMSSGDHDWTMTITRGSTTDIICRTCYVAGIVVIRPEPTP